MAEKAVVKANNGELELTELERAADYIVESKLFGVQNRNQAVALMLLAQAEGLHPMKAVQEYHIINGRPALKADAMLARFIRAGGRVEWHELSDKRAKATFSHPQGGTVTIEWTIDMAKAAGLADRDNWKKFPRAMLRARVVSEGVRTVYPGVAVGVYTPEEIMDFEEVQPAEPITVEGEVVSPEPPAEEPEPSEDYKQELLSEIKRLCKQLNYSADRLLVLCHKLGFTKVKKAKDVADLTVDQLQQLVAELGRRLTEAVHA